MLGKKTRTALLSLLLVGCATLVLGALADSRTRDDRAVRAFDEIVRSVSEPERIRMVTDILISADGDGETPPWTTTARYEYWQDGERFRVSARVAERETPLASDFDVSWDGETFYFWHHADGVLSLSTQLPAQLPVSLPHPLMLPLEPLSSSREECDGCLWIPAALHRGRVTSDRLLSAAISATGPSVARSLLTSSPSELRLTVAGGRAEGHDLRDEVTVMRRGGHWQVTEIERFAASGQTLSTLRFDRFRRADGNAGTRLYPRLIEVDVAGSPGSRGALRSLFATQELAINIPIDPHVFDLRREEPDKIWDADSEIFLRRVGR